MTPACSDPGIGPVTPGSETLAISDGGSPSRRSDPPPLRTSGRVSRGRSLDIKTGYPVDQPAYVRLPAIAQRDHRQPVVHKAGYLRHKTWVPPPMPHISSPLHYLHDPTQTIFHRRAVVQPGRSPHLLQAGLLKEVLR